ncbi:hypothetical protein U2F26_03285 [Micromonospora sp. 4G57]|uniref:PH domain-containing protein n=1 Tax=Micromonospora sicca TaxID=2202420 RepID=A0ABU5JCK0_9ACTN|nr:MULTISPECIES: hypothetical protein [unclassified Micromonospora]MDZ5441755.1 hypothetical protein [Micromonospora sp. 4G57]MDZ5490316.1 hypothetical protein [Micromonospora sp. 4G53]
MTEQERVEWEQRLRAAVVETIRRRQARRRQRQELDDARNHGLRQRHATKLNRRNPR